MVGIVVVSHSQRLAEGVVELAQMMAPDAPVAAAGGLDDGTTGTSFEKIIYAIRDVYTEEGAAILVDLGSAGRRCRNAGWNCWIAHWWKARFLQLWNRGRGHLWKPSWKRCRKPEA